MVTGFCKFMCYELWSGYILLENFLGKSEPLRGFELSDYVGKN